MTTSLDDDLLAHSVTEEEYSLRQLHYWLRYEGLTPLLGGFAFFVPYGLVMTVLVGLAVVFAPYMVWQLWRAKWFKTLAVFAVCVGVPLVVSRFVSADSFVLKFLLTYGPLVPFYFFTWILRLVIGEELAERSGVRLFDHERERSAE